MDDDVRRIIYGVLVLFILTIVGYISFIYVSGCGFTLNCPQGQPLVVRTPIPSLIPATMPVAERNRSQGAFNKCQVAAVDLLVLHRDAHEVSFREATATSIGWIGIGLAFGAGVWVFMGPTAGGEYFAGYLIEKALAVDNIFVFALIFAIQWIFLGDLRSARAQLASSIQEEMVVQMRRSVHVILERHMAPRPRHAVGGSQVRQQLARATRRKPQEADSWPPEPTEREQATNADV